jgi:methionine-rich copper-binding protein CopC
MMSRRLATFWLASAGLLLVQAGAWAQDLRMVETKPADHAVIDGRGGEFFVRFDRPVDHIHSLLSIMRDGNVVQALQPRFKSAPDVLFAMAPALPPGEYKLHWSVRTLAGADLVDGETSFTVGPGH